MRKQMYDADIAQEYGIVPAVVLDAIRRWIEYNAANAVNIYDGKVWTFSSKEGWAKQFPEFSKDQVRRALDKLREDELLEIGNYNKVAFDRKLWYTLTPKAMDLLYGEVGPLGKFANSIMTKLPDEIRQNCPIRLGTDARPIESNNINTNKDILSTNTKPPKKPRASKAFVPPTLEEVKAYIQSRNSIVDAKAFFEFYDVGHWVDSNGKPVKNWKQKLLTWEKNSKNTNQPQEPVRPKTEAPKVSKDTIGSSFFDEFNN